MMNEEIQNVYAQNNIIDVRQGKIELDIRMILTQLGIKLDRWQSEFMETSSVQHGQKQ